MQKKQNFSFFKRLYQDKPAFYLICVLAIAAFFACFLIYYALHNTNSQKTKTAMPEDKVVQPDKSVKKRPPVKNNRKAVSLEYDLNYNNQAADAMEELTEQFEQDAINYTDAAKIRVESKGLDTPGYVAFMCRPEGFKKGIPVVEQELAELYLKTFPDAPRITISLIVGGGIRSRQTFLRDPEFGVISGAEKARLNQEKHKIE